MTPMIPGGQRDQSPLGCRLHDWNLASRDWPSEMRHPDVRGIVFDLDDTLYPQAEFVRSGFMAVAEHIEHAHGVPAPDAFEYLLGSRRAGKHRNEFQSLCAKYELPGELVAGMLEVFRTHQPTLSLPPASLAALTTLKANGWRLVILTNGLPTVQRAKVRALGVASLVDAVVYAEEHASGGKPAVTVFVEALRRISVPARRAICVGDDPVRDIAGARQLGILTVHLQTPAMMPDPEADAVLSSLEGLPRLAHQLLEGAAIDAA